MKLLTLDYGGTFIKYGLMDDDINFSNTGTVPAPLSSKEAFKEATKGIYDQYRGEVDGVAISMPGIIDSDRGIARSAGAYSAILNGTNMFELLDFIDVPLAVENDGKAAILAEMWKGSLQGVDNAAACVIGSGLGGGIVMDGKLRKGGHFASGEISGLMMTPGKPAINDAAASRASMSAFLMMVAHARHMNPANFEISGFNLDGEADPNVKRISGKDVFEWIEEGQPETCAVYDQWLDALTMVLFNLKMTLDPEKIVIGGGVSRNPRLIKDLRARFSAACEPLKIFNFPGCDLDVCKFSSDANMVGAAYNWVLHNAND